MRGSSGNGRGPSRDQAWRGRTVVARDECEVQVEAARAARRRQLGSGSMNAPGLRIERVTGDEVTGGRVRKLA